MRDLPLAPHAGGESHRTGMSHRERVGACPRQAAPVVGHLVCVWVWVWVWLRAMCMLVAVALLNELRLHKRSLVPAPASILNHTRREAKQDNFTTHEHKARSIVVLAGCRHGHHSNPPRRIRTLRLVPTAPSSWSSTPSSLNSAVFSRDDPVVCTFTFTLILDLLRVPLPLPLTPLPLPLPVPVPVPSDLACTGSATRFDSAAVSAFTVCPRDTRRRPASDAALLASAVPAGMASSLAPPRFRLACRRAADGAAGCITGGSSAVVGLRTAVAPGVCLVAAAATASAFGGLVRLSCVTVSMALVLPPTVMN